MPYGAQGRPVSWIAVAVIVIGFTVGGLGLVIDQWWLFWTGAGITVTGSIFAWAIDIMEDYTTDQH